METSLDHLPESKQAELQTVVRMILQTHPVEWIILFGSYARGDYVEELAPEGCLSAEPEHAMRQSLTTTLVRRHKDGYAGLQTWSRAQA